MFGALMAIPLLLPFVARHRYVAFALPCLVLLVAARRCWGAATRRPLDRNAWRVLGVGNAMCAVAAALAAASPLGGGLVKAALYAGSSGSLGLLVAAALLARRWATGARLERVVDALLFDAVVIAVGVYFVVVPGFTRGDAVLTGVFLIDLVALAIVSVAAIEAADRDERTAGWCLVGACAAASIGDGLVAAANFGGGGSPPLTALMWTLAGAMLLLAASDWRDATPRERSGSRWIGLRVLLPLTAVLFFPALTLVLSIGTKLSAATLAYFGGFFVVTLALTFGRQAYLLGEHRRAAARERRLRREVVRRNEELEALTTLAATMTDRLEEDPIVERGLDAVRLGVRATSVALHTDVDGSLRLLATVGDWASEGPWASRRAVDDRSAASEVRGERLIVRLPLVARSRELGLITAIRPAADPLSAEELDLLRLLVGQLALAIQNARDYQERVEQAIRDSLTGVYNRRYFFEALEQEHHRSVRSGEPLSLVLIDVDDFKRVNDTLGHAAGDAVLRELTRIGSELVRPADTFARLGGEEFAVLLPATGQLDALFVAERVRRAAATDGLLAERGVTVSAGIATWPDDAAEREALMARADAALYWAKRNGKNICAAASEVVVVPDADDEDGSLAHLHALVAVVDGTYGRNHSHDVAAYALAIGQRLGLSGERLTQLRRAALFHDIGTIAVAGQILAKRGALVEGEVADIRAHPEVGESMLLHCGLQSEAAWVRHHHERVDGGGYPDGVSGRQLPLEARIVAVADAFEAMTAGRPYSPPLAPDAALAEARRCAGSQFDARVVEALARVVADRDVPLATLS